MNLSFSAFTDRVAYWWQHSILHGAIARLGRWQTHSRLTGGLWLGGLLLLLLTTLPFASNGQIGLILTAIAGFWGLTWVGDRAVQRSGWTPMHWPLSMYLAIASVAAALSPVRRAAFDGWVKLALYAVLFLALHRVLRLGSRWRSLLVGAYLLVALATSIYGLRQWIFGAEPLATWVDAESEFAGTTRVYSFLNNPNLLAGFLLPAIPLSAVGTLHWRRGSVKLVSGIACVASLACLLLTYSRGALIGLTVMAIVLAALLAWWWRQRLPQGALPGIAIATVGGLAALVTGVPSLRKRALSIFSGRGDSSNNFRLNVWSSVLEMIRDRPLLGIGPGNKAFNAVYPFYQRSNFSALGAYSVPLELCVETGVVGLLCYGWLVVTVLRVGWQCLNARAIGRASGCDPNDGLWLAGSMAAIAGMLGHGLVDTVWYRPQVQVLWWLAIALVASFWSLPHVPLEETEMVAMEGGTQR